LKCEDLKDGYALDITPFTDDNPSLTIQANAKRVMNLPSSNGFDVVTIQVEHLNAIIATISHHDIVIRINNEMARILDPPSTHN